MKNPQIIYLMLFIVQVTGPVIMDTVVIIIQAEPVFLIPVLCLSHRVPVPVSVPCQRTFVQNAADRNYFSVDPPVRDTPSAILRDQGRNQHRQLGIKRVSVSITVLVIYPVAPIGNLMALKSLHRQIIAVVNHYLIPFRQTCQGIRSVAAVIGAAHGKKISFHFINRTFLSLCLTAHNADTAVIKTGILIGKLRQPDYRSLIVAD